MVPGATTGATSEINTAASCLNRPRFKGGRQVAHFKLPESQIPPGGMIVKVAIPGRTARRPVTHRMSEQPGGMGREARLPDRVVWVQAK